MKRSAPEIEALLTSEGFYQDPYPVYERLRASHPVYWSDTWGQWLVTRHADVLTILKDADRFSSAGYEQRLIGMLGQGAEEEFPELSAHYRASVLSRSDPPLHTRLRKLLTDQFTPRFVAGLKPRVDRIVNDTLSALPGRGEVDFVADYAYPIPALVVAEMLGLDPGDHTNAIEWSRDLTSFVGTGAPSRRRAKRADHALAAFRSALLPLLEVRRTNPQDDLVSLLVSRGDESGMSDEELLATCVTLMFAGHETTANLLGNGMLALLRAPSQLAYAQSPTTDLGPVAEELLRFDTSVQRVRRVVAHPTTLHGQQLNRGDLVMAFLGSANRDGDRIDEPTSLDIRRGRPPHLAFGHGIHFCVGAALARLEAPVALRAFLDRYRELRLIEGTPPTWAKNLTFRQLTALPVAVSE